MKVMLLCAGLGTRLRPLTGIRAKPVLPVLNKPLIVHTLELLEKAGVREVMINLHHLPGTITGALKSFAPPGMQILYSHEDPILGSAGGIKRAEAFFEGRRGIILNGDTLMDFSLEDLVSFHEKSGAIATMVLKEQVPGEKYAPVLLDSTGKITGIAGRPPLPAGEKVRSFLYTGLQLIEPEVFAEIPRDVPWEMNARVYPDMIRKGWPVYGFVAPWFWLDFGTPQDYLDSNMSLLSCRPRLPFYPLERGLAVKTLRGGSDRNKMAGDVKLEDGVTGTGGIIAGPGCILRQGISCNRTLILENTVIGRNTTISNSIIGPGLEIPSRSVIRNRIVIRNREGEILEQSLT